VKFIAGAAIVSLRRNIFIIVSIAAKNVGRIGELE
jgi:hypothetical protein